MHTYIRTCIHTHIHIYTHTYRHIFTHAYTHIHSHIHTYIHSHIHTYIHIHYIYTFTHTYIHIYTHIHIYIHTGIRKHSHIHIYIHTHTHTHKYTQKSSTRYRTWLKPGLPTFHALTLFYYHPFSQNLSHSFRKGFHGNSKISRLPPSSCIPSEFIISLPDSIINNCLGFECLRFLVPSFPTYFFFQKYKYFL
jgi:hypothetical protein